VDFLRRWHHQQVSSISVGHECHTFGIVKDEADVERTAYR
jgi:hypothetical protein